jgi:adenylate cyclase class 2
MMEIELKAYVDDTKKLEKNLNAIGAIFIKDSKQIDIYYTPSTRNFLNTDEVLRVRSTDSEHILTYKGPRIKNDFKTREEHEVKIDDVNELITILTKLEFHEIGRVSKTRKVYKLQNFEICLDCVDDLGTFVEIECKDTTSSKDIYKLLHMLGLPKTERKSYLELLQLSQKFARKISDHCST